MPAQPPWPPGPRPPAEPPWPTETVPEQPGPSSWSRHSWDGGGFVNSWDDSGWGDSAASHAWSQTEPQVAWGRSQGPSYGNMRVHSGHFRERKGNPAGPRYGQRGGANNTTRQWWSLRNKAQSEGWLELFFLEHGKHPPSKSEPY